MDHEIEADQEEIQKGIRSVIRQIIATISVLPFLDGVFTSGMLMYTDKNTALPSNKWEDAKQQFLNRLPILCCPLRYIDLTKRNPDAPLDFRPFYGLKRLLELVIISKGTKKKLSFII